MISVHAVLLAASGDARTRKNSTAPEDSPPWSVSSMIHQIKAITLRKIAQRIMKIMARAIFIMRCFMAFILACFIPLVSLSCR